MIHAAPKTGFVEKVGLIKLPLDGMLVRTAASLDSGDADFRNLVGLEFDPISQGIYRNTKGGIRYLPFSGLEIRG